MSVPKVLKRLLRIRAVEEEQRRRALDSAMAKLQWFEQARAAALQMEKDGRARVAASVSSGAVGDRQAGLVETELARRRARYLAARIAASRIEAAERREEFLTKRVERRQAATLVQEVEARDEQEAERRAQQGMDDWYGMARHRQASDRER